MPPLWFFTDAARLADPRGIVARLPKNLCGVVLRHDEVPDRAALGRDLARLCRARGNVLVVAGDWKLARELHAGLHLRGGYWRGGGNFARHGKTLVTSSAHDRAQVVRAARAGVDAIFVSPMFATASHPGARSLGLVRWLLVSSGFHGARLVLGGVSVAKLRGIAVPQIFGLGAIGCFAE